MYTRVPSGRMPRGMRVPENYSGNAFRAYEPPPTPPPPRETPKPDEPDLPDVPPQNAESAPADLPKAEEPSTAVAKQAPFGLHLPFAGLHLGFEELLLIGIILMIAQEGKNDDVIWLLLLLLFL